jgi:hypothetical protein
MRKFSRDSFNITEAINELMHESGVIVIENAYNLKDIKEAREIINHFADTKNKKKLTLMLKLKHLIKLNYNKGYGIYLVKERFLVN